MADHKHPGRSNTRLTRGQALVEYVLIVVFVMFFIIIILAATGPAIGNVFSNTVYNLLNQTQTPGATLNAQQIKNYATAYASYTPPAIAITPNTPVTEKNKPPTCQAQTFNIDPPATTRHEDAPGALKYCTDPNGDPMTVVSWSLAPASGAGALTLSQADGAYTYDSQGFGGGYVGISYEVSDDKGAMGNGFIYLGVNTAAAPPKTSTATPKPSATPMDIAFTYPFYDRGDTPDNWQHDFLNVLHGPWVVDYFSDASFGTKVGNSGSAFWKAGAETLNENWGTGAPVGGITPPVFSIRYTADPVDIEPRAYQILLSVSGHAVLTIDGATVISVGNDDGSVQTQVVNYDAPGTTQHTVVLEYKHTVGAASLRLDFNKLADTINASITDCSWGTTGSKYHSELSAWQDSSLGTPPNYVADTTCNLRLRGYITLPSGSAAKPQFSFWDRWDLGSQDVLYVGVRDYQSANPWTWVSVHSSPADARSLNWRHQVYDLSNFGGVDFRGKEIEIAYQVYSYDSSVGDGWYIDDIAVEDNTPKTYTVGFYDDVENSQISPQNWLNECNWQRTNYDQHSGAYSWTSNGKGATYSNNDDCSLMLNGLVDLTAYASPNTTGLEVAFWSKAILTTSSDQVSVETRLDGSATWTALTPMGSTDTFVAKATADTTWHEVVVRLDALRGKKFSLRFRLLADGDSNNANGWHIDDIQLREHAVVTVGVPFLEPFDNLDRWLVSGTWGLTTGPNAPYYSAPTALTDSPGVDASGNPVKYPVPINSQVELIPSIDLAGTNHPVLSFWTYWNADANLYVEISKDGGGSWEAPVWQKITNTGFDGITTQLAWQRVKIDLTPYKNANPPTQDGMIRVRFRLQASSGTPMDGWYIDDLAVQEDDFSAVKLSNGTYLDNMDSASSADNWLPGGTWQIASGQGKDGSDGWSDSQADYVKPERSELEFKQAIDLSGTSEPTLYFWTKHTLGDTADQLYAEVSTDNGFTWNTSAPIWSNPELTNQGWHRIQIDLTSFKSGSPIRVRFRLEATNALTSADGWYIDDFTLFDRANLTNLGSTFEDNFNDFSNWVAEGDWTAVPNLYSGWTYQPASFIPQPVTYSSVTPPLVTSNWVGDYWHVDTSHTEVWNATGVAAWPDAVSPAIPPNIKLDNSPGEINFDYTINPDNKPFAESVTQWHLSDPLATHDQYYLMRWQRQYQVTSPGTYLLRLRFAGGARLYINGALQTPTTTLGKPYVLDSGVNSNPFIVDDTLRSYWYQVPLSGTFTIKIEYYHKDSSSGPGKIEFAVSEPSTVARTSNGTTPADVYSLHYRTSLILDGLLTIPAGKVGAVAYQEHFSFSDGGWGRVYYSMDEGFTWTEVTSVKRGPNNSSGTPGSTEDWTNTSFYITNSGAVFSTATPFMLKFELETLRATVGDEGWLIDNFQFFGTDLVPNTAPVSSSATFMGITSTPNQPLNFCVTPSVLDNGGDSWTFAPVTPVRGQAWQQGNQLCYNPPDEWTGHTTFQYTVTDSGSLTMPGYATATVDIVPDFFKAVDVNGSTALNILGNPWSAWGSGTGTSFNASAGSSSTLALDVPQDANTTSMLRSWMNYDGSGTMSVSIRGLENPGVYTVYVWVIESTATAYTYDLYLDSTSRMRPVNGYYSGSQGHWSRLGPFTMINPGTQLDIYPLSSFAKVAGIEVWRGGTSDQWTSADIGFTTPGANYGTTPENTNTSLRLTSTGIDINSDITAGADDIRYAFKAETGDLDIVAQVSWNGAPPSDRSKVGLMIRASDASNAAEASVTLANGSTRGVYFRWRASTGDTTTGSSNTTGITGTRWLKLSKVGDTFTAYQSSNGTTWSQIGTPQTVNLGNQFLIGSVVAARAAGTADGNIDNIQITQR